MTLLIAVLCIAHAPEIDFEVITMSGQSLIPKEVVSQILRVPQFYELKALVCLYTNPPINPDTQNFLYKNERLNLRQRDPIPRTLEKVCLTLIVSGTPRREVLYDQVRMEYLPCFQPIVYRRIPREFSDEEVLIGEYKRDWTRYEKYKKKNIQTMGEPLITTQNGYVYPWGKLILECAHWRFRWVRDRTFDFRLRGKAIRVCRDPVHTSKEIRMKRIERFTKVVTKPELTTRLGQETHVSETVRDQRLSRFENNFH